MKKLTLLLAVIMCALLIVSCSNVDTPADTTTQATPDTTAPVETQLPPLSIVSGGTTEYKVIRSDNSAKAVTDISVTLRSAIEQAYGLEKMGIGTDFERNVDPANRYQYEILVGLTNRDESIEAFDSIKYNDFIIKVSGTRVAIVGGNDEKTVEAVNYFIENYLEADSLLVYLEPAKEGDKLELDGNHEFILRGEYAKDNITLLGSSISDFAIVCPNSYKEYAQIMNQEIGGLCGNILPIHNDSSDAVEKEIIIASTKRGCSVAGYGYDDYAIRVEGNKIYVEGGSNYAVGSGCRELLNLIKDTNGDIGASALNIKYVLPDRQDYINDISKLAMHWDIYMDTPEWMLDFEEKTAAMNDPDGRLMSCIHRGEADFYPENSIEGIISAIKLGGDMVEIDPRLTKDGVLILLHDETLTRTTNVAELAGKNGLPSSHSFEMWTYEQLQQLSLKEAAGGDNAKLTNYKIPTLDEAMKVCANRIFIRLDVKPDVANLCWSYEKDIWPMMQKYESYTNVIFTWHSIFTGNGYATIKKYKPLMEAACGSSAFSFIGMNASSNARSTLSTIASNKLDNCIRLTDCNFTNTPMPEYLDKVRVLMAALRGNARVYIDAHGSKSKYETPECYAELHEMGINILLVDKGYELCKYISENFTATEK